MKEPERGSGTIWMLAMACVLLTAACLAASLTAVMSAGRRADVAADLAALSAVASSCKRAAEIATAHHARLISCRPLDLPDARSVVEVTTEVRTPPILGHVFVQRSRARAGRSGPSEFDAPLPP